MQANIVNVATSFHSSSDIAICFANLYVDYNIIVAIFLYLLITNQLSIFEKIKEFLLKYEK